MPAIAQHKGARSAFLLVNRETGEALSIGLYDDEAAAKAFGPKAEKVAEQLKKYMEKAEVKREIYEVAAGTQQEARQVVERGMKAFNAHDTGEQNDPLERSSEVRDPGRSEPGFP